MFVAEHTFQPEQKGSLKVHSSRSVRRAKVVPDGKNLVSHAGAALLAELADRSGLTEAMSVAMKDCGINWHTHDPGVVLTHLAVAIAVGADCLAEIAALKEQEELLTDMTLRRFGLPACTASPEGLPPSLAQHGSC